MTATKKPGTGKVPILIQAVTRSKLIDFVNGEAWVDGVRKPTTGPLWEKREGGWSWRDSATGARSFADVAKGASKALGRKITESQVRGVMLVQKEVLGLGDYVPTTGVHLRFLERHAKRTESEVSAVSAQKLEELLDTLGDVAYNRDDFHERIRDLAMGQNDLHRIVKELSEDLAKAHLVALGADSGARETLAGLRELKNDLGAQMRELKRDLTWLRQGVQNITQITTAAGFVDKVSRVVTGTRLEPVTQDLQAERVEAARPTALGNKG